MEWSLKEMERISAALRRLEEELKDLRPGDFVQVLWIDASRSECVDARRLPLPNFCVETVRREPRLFLGVQKGKRYGDPHLLLADEVIDSPANTTIDSIPLYLVKRVVKVGEKKPLSTKRCRMRKLRTRGRIRKLYRPWG